MWIEIFKAGEHRDSSGTSLNFSADDIQNIADIYNSEKAKSANYSAPLVKGHPKSDSPAFAWVEKLARRQNSLYAKLSKISDEIVEEINAGKFKNVSIALYPNKLLKHVGLLGAAQPAVKGLAELKFNEGGNSDIEIAELINAKSKLENELQELENRKKYNLFNEFAEKMIADKMIITPAKKDKLLEILKNASQINLETEIMNFIESIGNYDLTIEIPSIKNEISKATFDDNVDEKRMGLHTETLKLMQNLPELSYEEAAAKAFSEYFLNY